MTTIDNRVLESEAIDNADIEQLKARVAKYVLFVVAGVVLLSFCMVQFVMDWLEVVCPACFGR
jgi:hypothetical protein